MGKGEEKDRLAEAREKNIPWKKNARNSEWFHMLNEDIISMPGNRWKS